MLMKNFDPNQGMCNGTRLQITKLHENLVEAKIISGSNIGETVLIPRINMESSKISLPFPLSRRQFPIKIAFSMTINKAQGQTFEKVGIYLDEPVFSHGQLYVALSRCNNRDNIKVHVKESEDQGDLLKNGKSFTKNIVYNEVL